MSQPTVSKHWRRVVSHPDRPQSNHAHLTVLQYYNMHADITSSHKLRSNITSIQCYDIFLVFQSTDEWSLRSPAWFTCHCSVNHRHTCCMIFISPLKVAFVRSHRQLTNVLSSVPRTRNTFAETFFVVYGTICHLHYEHRTSTMVSSSMRWRHFVFN